ncbi:hypothetical protein [Niallia sp. XMNu-256]
MWALNSNVFSMTQTEEELSIVCSSQCFTNKSIF